MDGAPAHRHRARLSGRGRAGSHRDAGAPHLAVVQPPQVHQAGARLPAQVADTLHVAEPGDGEDALQLQPPLDGAAHRGGVAFMRGAAGWPGPAADTDAAGICAGLIEPDGRLGRAISGGVSPLGYGVIFEKF